MVTQRRRTAGALCAALAAGLVLFMSACDKVPLLAPSGTVITLFPVSNTVALGGEVEIVATVIEQGVTSTPPSTGNGTGNGNGTPTTPTTTTTPTTGAGTPVQNGTLVSFTTTIGRIEPSEARTQNGQVRVRFIAGNQSGTATITAFSGGASGRLENLRVGTAAVERVILSANPQALGPSGGSTEIQARVEDVNGLGLSGVPVSFTASAGALSPNPATTDANGVATTTLSTTQEAEVTASVGGKTSETALKITLRPRTGIRITAPTDTVTAGQPARFTIGVSENANVSNVTVSYGDGDSDSLGALSGETTIAHVYDEAGTYRVQASARDVTGFTESVATSLTVLPGQPPGVTITASNPTPAINEVITLIANVTGATSTIVRYSWNFGADAVPATLDTTSNRVTVRWTTAGTKGITVTVFQATGPSGDGGTTVVVRP